MRNRSHLSIVREARQEKLVPFTVSNIGNKEDLAQWRIDQAIKEAKWQSEAPARYNEAKNIALTALHSGKTWEDPASVAYSKLGRPKLKVEIDWQPKPNTVPWYTKAISALTSWFSRINFGF